MAAPAGRTSAEAMTEVGGAVIHRDGRVEYPAQES